MSRQSAKRSMNRAVATVLENLEARRLLTAGNLEGSGTRDILGIDEARGIASNPANDIFVAGQASNRFGVAKFNASGVPVSHQSAVIGSGAQASAVVASNATVYVGGLVGTSNLNFAIQRFDAATLATVGSVVTTDFSGGTDRIRAMLLLPGNRLLAVGESSDNFALAMYDATSLSLIPSFGTAGRQVIPSAAIDTVGGVVFDAGSDRIVLAGSTAGVLTLRAFNATNGSDLATYSTSITASAAGIQLSGPDFVVAANDGSSAQIVKVAGSLSSHTVSAPTSGDATGITVQPHDGRIAISVNDGMTQKLVRFNTDLSFDSSDLLDGAGAVGIPAGTTATAGLIQLSTSSTRRLAVATSTSSDDFGLTLFDANVDPIVGTNASPINVSAGGTRVLNATLLQITDDDDSLTSGFVFTVTQLPSGGTLTKASVPLTVGGTFTQADIDNGLIAYNNTSGTTDTFTFTATDSFGGDVGGLTPAATTVTFNMTVPSTTWVDDNWDILTDLGASGLSNGDIVADTGTAEWNTSVPTLVFGVDAFSSINDAIAAVGTAGTTNVLSGQYSEFVTVNKPISIAGPNASLSGNSVARMAEAVVVPPSNNVTTGVLMDVTVAGVSIRGLTLDGDNSSVSGGVAINGVDVNANTGVRGRFGGLTVGQNIIRNFSGNGVQLTSFDSTTPNGNNIVSENLIDNMAADGPSFFGRGVLIQQNAYASVTDNVISRARAGIQTNNHWLANPGAPAVISGNSVTYNVRGIFHNLQYQDASPFTISNNTITAGPGAVVGSGGLQVFSIQSSVSTTLSNNSIVGGTYGIQLWNLPTTSTVSVSGGTVTNAGIGLWVTNSDPSFGSASATTAAVSGLTISNASVAGVRVDGQTGSNSVSLAVNDLTINDGPVGIDVNGALASLVGNTLGDTVFEDQTSQYLTLRNAAHFGTIVSAGLATFDGLLGNSAGAPLEDKIIHKIDDAGVGLVEWVDDTIFVTDTATPTPNNNDYTRINNAIYAASNGYTINLVGSFDWVESHAASSWATGSDYNPTTTSDNFRIKVPGGLSNITLTAPGGLGTATVQGPGDLATTNFEAFLRFDGGSNSSSDNQNWTISNLTLLDFDLAIAMFNSSAGGDAFNNTSITNNFIRVPADLNAVAAPADVGQNIAIHYSFGSNQTISDNTIQIVGSGASNGSNFSSSVGLQSNTSGGAVYDGLLIDNNTINVTGTLNAQPSVVLGIFENAHGHTSDITVSNNAFNNLTGPNATTNLMRAFRVTSHSSNSTSVQYLNNSAVGANIAFQWLAGSNFIANAPVILSNNLISNANTGYLIQSNGSAVISNGSISGASGVGVDITVGSHATVNGVSLQNLDIGIRVAGSASMSGNNFNAGTDNGTDIQLLGSAGTTTIGAGNSFGGSNYFIDNASTNAFDLTSYTPANFEGLNASVLSDAFTIEDRLRHALDLSSAGLIRVQTGQLFITNPGTGLTDESIQNAVDAASSGDTLFIQGGTNPHAPTTVSANPVAGYPGQLVNITKTLTLQGVSNPIISSASASASASPGRALFNVAAPNVTFKDLQLEVDRTKTQVGIQAFENFAGLNIDNLLIRAQGGSPGTQYQPPALVGSSPPSSAGVFVYNLSGTGAPAVTVKDSEIVHGNHPTAPTLTDPFFLRPLSLWGVSANITNNLLTGTGADAQLVNLGTSTITGNTIPSAGMTLVGRQAGATVTLSSNTFDQPDAGPFPTASLIIRDVQVDDAGGVIVQNNTFTNVRSNRPAIISGRSQDITIANNTFSAASGASNFSYINIASSYPTSGIVSPGSNSVTIQGNTFGAGNGTSLLFENGVAGSTWGPINVGGAGAMANTFNSGLAEFIRLATTKSTYNAGATNLPFDIDLNITGNQFDVGSGPERPDALSWTAADSFALEAKAFHKIDNAAVGLLTWVANTLFVVPVSSPSASTNDYTVIANALDIAQNSWTIQLGKNGPDATFNWNEPNALASWELGNDASANTDDDWSALIRSGLTGLTITAALADAISIQGAGDLTTTALEAGFLAYLGGSNANLTIENFKIQGIDNAIGLYAGSGSNFSGLTIQNMHIVVPADNDTEPSDFQNIGIHYGLGQNISIVNNTIDFVGSGTDPDAQSVGIQSNTHGGNNYNGLNISNNTFNVLNPGSEGILGLWENGHAHASNITVENNTFNGDARADSTAILVTSHSGASTTVEYKNNTINAFETGIEWLESYANTPQNYSGTNAVKLTGNTISASGTAIKIGGIQAKADLVNNNFNSGTDNQTDLFIASDSGMITFGAGNLFGGDQYFINNESAQSIDLTSYNISNFEGLDKASLADAFEIENRLRHAPDLASAGLIRINTGHVYVTTPGAEIGVSDETIQRAINAASAGDTVNVQDGTYVEQLDITKDLTIDGQSRTGVIVKAPATLGLGNSFTYGQVRQPVVGIRSNSTVTLQDLTVDGDGRGGAVVSGNDFLGIGVHNSNATIDNVTVTGVRDSTLNGIQRGRAIFVGNNSGLPRSIEVSNSSILDYQKNGIDVRGANITVDINNNQITGAGATPLIAQNGIVLLDGAGGSISNNDVSSHRYTGAGTVSTGMLLWNAPSGTTISNNTISSNDVSLTIEQSSIVGVTSNSITASDIGVRVSGAAQATLTGNNFNAAGDNKTDVRINSTAGTVTLGAGNQFAGDDLFIDLRSTQNIDLASLGYDAANYEGLNPASVADAFGIEDKMNHRLDVGNTSAGLIRVVNGQLFVTTPGSGVTNESIQNAVDAATAGETVHVQAGTYVENVVVNKNLSLLSESGRSATTIQGISGVGALGTLLVTNNTTSFNLGSATGNGFTVIGIDNNTPGLEAAAVYFQGGHSGAQIRHNDIRANGDVGLLTEFNLPITNFIIDNNIFSGQTFLGANPAGVGFGAQFTLPNVPRQLVVIGSGAGTTSTANIQFTNNQITGTAGGMSVTDNAGNPISPTEQGNGLVTIDAIGSTLTSNTFSGTTTRFGTSLRARGANNTISNNTFNSSTMGAATTELFIQRAGNIISNNTFTSSAGVAIDVAGNVSPNTGGATISNNTIDVAGIGIRTNANTSTVVRGNNLNGNAIGVLVAGGTVDLGTTLDAGNNNFTGYTSPATSSSGAIVVTSNDSLAGPQGSPLDVPAFGNLWATPTPTGIENVIFHDADDSARRFVDYAGLTLVNANVVETSINESGLATFDISFTNDPQAHTLVIDWGDGTIQTVNLASGIFSASLTHTYVDDNPTGTASDNYTVSWTLTDSSLPVAGTLSGSDSLVVNNVAPTLTITSITASINENNLATLVANVVDPGTTEVFAFEIDWADPNSPGVTTIPGLLSSASASGTVGNTSYAWNHLTRQITLTHIYSDDGITSGNATAFDVSSVTLTVRDDDLGSDSKSTDVTVNNVAPTSLAVTPDVGNVYNEGNPISFTLSASDNPADVLGYSWSVSGPGLLAPITGTGALVTFTPLDNGVYTINYTVTDDDTGVASAIYTVPTVGNVAPVLTGINVSPTTLNEGSSITITGTYTDIGSADSHTLDLDLDGDGAFEITGVVISGGSFSYTHTYTDDNPTSTASDPRHIKVRVRDDDGAQSNELSQSVTVNNVAPSPTITGILAGDEGSSFNFGSTVVDPGTDTFDYLWTVTKNSLPYAVVGNTSATFSFVPDNSGPGAVWVVTLQVTDDDGGVNSTSQTLTVNDVAPTLPISPAAQSINESTLATITLSDLIDPGVGDLSAILSLSVTWGDGNFTTLSLAQLNLLRDGNPLTTVTLTHAYADDATLGTSSDVYAIEVNVTTSNKGIYSNVGPATEVTVNNLNPDGFISLPIPGTLPALTNRPVDAVGLFDPSAADLATLRFAFGVESTVGGNGIFDAGDVVFGGLTWLTGTTSTGVSLPGASFPSAGTYRIFVRIMDDDNGFADKSILVNVSPLSFRVSSFGWTDSGFDVVFNRPFNKTGLNIHGTAPSDLLITRDPDGSGPLPAERVFGSLVWNGVNADRLTFVRTGGVLQPGTYAVTIVSGSTAFRDQIGSPSPFSFLDGNNDNVGGDNYVATPYVLAASSSRIVSFGNTTGLETNRFRDMSRGPGQPLAIPVGSSGLPLRINDGTGVVSFDFTLRYDPDLLTINALTLPPGLPGAWNITTNVVAPGEINVAIFGDTPLTAGARVFLLVDATVPATATYRDSHVVRLDNLLVNGGAITARSDQMVHSVNLLGDANGNGNYTGFDATLISQVAVGVRTHFNEGANFAYPLTDPVVVADVDASQTLTAFDAARVNSEAVGIDVPEIPTPPLFGRLPVTSDAPSAFASHSTAHVRAGQSSMLATGQKSTAMASTSQLVPLNVRQAAIAGAASAFTFEVNFDASRLRINPTTDLLGTELSRSLGLTIVGNLIAPGRLLVVAYGAQIGMQAIGTLVNARFSSIDASTTTVQVRAIHEAMGTQDALTLTSAHTLRFTRLATREGATAMLFSGESIL